MSEWRGIIPRMKKAALGLLAIVATTALAGCGTDEPSGPPTIGGKDATAVVQVECNDGGAASVKAVYGQSVREEFLSGSTFDHQYGVTENQEPVPLTVTTEPTTGTCVTKITDYESGEVVAKKTTAGKAELVVYLSGQPSSAN